VTITPSIASVGIVSTVLLLYCATRLIFSERSYPVAYLFLFLTTAAALTFLANRAFSPFWDLSNLAVWLTLVGYAIPGLAGYIAYAILIPDPAIDVVDVDADSDSDCDQGPNGH